MCTIIQPIPDYIYVCSILRRVPSVCWSWRTTSGMASPSLSMGIYMGITLVFWEFIGCFLVFLNSETPIVYPRLVNFNSKMVFCLVCCPRDHRNWSQIGCANSARYLKGTCSRLDSCNFLYLKAASEHSILQAFGCDPKGPRWPWGASPELFFQKRSWEVGSIKFFLATRNAMAFREFGGPCHYVLSGKFERVCQSGSTRVKSWWAKLNIPTFPENIYLKSVHWF